MRDKVLAAIELYASGGTITKAIAEAGLRSVTPFYATIRKDAEVMALYEAAIKTRSYVMLDEAYELGSDKDLDAKKARAQSEIRFKIANLTNPDRFGDRLKLEHEVRPSLIQAIDQGKARALRPQCDPALITDAEYTVIPSTCDVQASDMQSDEAALPAPHAPIDPFEP